LTSFWDPTALDEAATYEVSRDGGANFQTITMERIGESDAFVGNHAFTAETATSYFNSGVSGLGQILNNSTSQRIGQSITLAADILVSALSITATKVGSPVGAIDVLLIRNSAGVPSTLESDVVASTTINVSSISNGSDMTLTLNTPVIVGAGTYHVVYRPNSTYLAGYTGSDFVQLDGASTGGGKTIFNGTSWSADGTKRVRTIIFGFAQDLRVRITSSDSGKKLKGYGIYYDLDTNPIQTLQDTYQDLIDENCLGSENAALDKSIAGRGPRIRNAAGQLMEITLDANNNWVLYTVT
jgi:hypothetical protein